MPDNKRTKEVVVVDGFESFWAVSQPPKTVSVDEVSGSPPCHSLFIHRYKI